MDPNLSTHTCKLDVLRCCSETCPPSAAERLRVHHMEEPSMQSAMAQDSCGLLDSGLEQVAELAFRSDDNSLQLLLLFIPVDCPSCCCCLYPPHCRFVDAALARAAACSAHRINLVVLCLCHDFPSKQLALLALVQL